MPKLFALAPYLPLERLECSCEVCKFSVSMFKLLQVLNVKTFLVFPCLRSFQSVDSRFCLLKFSQEVYERYLTYGNLSYDLLTDADFLGVVNFRCLNNGIYCLKRNMKMYLSFSELTYANMLLCMSNFKFSIDDSVEDTSLSPLEVLKEGFSFEQTYVTSALITGEYAALSRNGIRISAYDHIEIRVEYDELSRLLNNLNIFSLKRRKVLSMKLRIRRFQYIEARLSKKPIGTGKCISSFRLSAAESQRLIRLNLDKYPP